MAARPDALRFASRLNKEAIKSRRG